MKARWYAAKWKVGEVLALKELLDFDDGNELPLFIAGPSLIETQAVRDERAEWVANARNVCGKKAVPLDREGAAGILWKTALFDFE